MIEGLILNFIMKPTLIKKKNCSDTKYWEIHHGNKTCEPNWERTEDRSLCTSNPRGMRERRRQCWWSSLGLCWVPRLKLSVRGDPLLHCNLHSNLSCSVIGWGCPEDLMSFWGCMARIWKHMLPVDGVYLERHSYGYHAAIFSGCILIALKVCCLFPSYRGCSFSWIQQW